MADSETRKSPFYRESPLRSDFAVLQTLVLNPPVVYGVSDPTKEQKQNHEQFLYQYDSFCWQPFQRLVFPRKERQVISLNSRLADDVARLQKAPFTLLWDPNEPIKIQQLAFHAFRARSLPDVAHLHSLQSDDTTMLRFYVIWMEGMYRPIHQREVDVSQTAGVLAVYTDNRDANHTERIYTCLRNNADPAVGSRTYLQNISAIFLERDNHMYTENPLTV